MPGSARGSLLQFGISPTAPSIPSSPNHLIGTVFAPLTGIPVSAASDGQHRFYRDFAQ
jgi:hypothetical protein